MASNISKVKFFLSIALIVFSFLGLYFRLELLDTVVINTWVIRDFDRAFNLVNGLYMPTAGPELSSSGRLPGPFLYFLLAIPILIKPLYQSVFNFNLLLNILSVFCCFFVVKRHFGFYISLISTILILISPPHIGVVGFPANPSFLFPFITLYFCINLIHKSTPS